jgi:hypothetical protein
VTAEREAAAAPPMRSGFAWLAGGDAGQLLHLSFLNALS